MKHTTLIAQLARRFGLTRKTSRELVAFIEHEQRCRDGWVMVAVEGGWRLVRCDKCNSVAVGSGP